MRATTSTRAAALLLILLGLPLLAITLPAADSKSKIDSAMDAFWDAKYDGALALVGDVLKDPDSKADERIDAHKVACCVYVARDARARARQSIIDMFDIDSRARFSPDYLYPPAVITLYHSVHDSLFEGLMDIRTVAIGDFENNSIYTGKFKDYDFDLFKNALVHILTQDFAEATPFRVVDRQRTAELLKEIELSASEFSDPGQSVRMGKFLGAHCFIFGQYVVLSKKEVRIDARVVHTATGEVILTESVVGEFGGKPAKFLKLEKDLMKQLAGGLTKFVSDMGGELGDVDESVEKYFDAKESSVKKRDGYVEAKFLIAEAIELEEASNYAGAVERWQQVLDKDPANEVAKVRIQVLSPLVRG